MVKYLNDLEKHITYHLFCGIMTPLSELGQDWLGDHMNKFYKGSKVQKLYLSNMLPY